jgi:hypothetical protein
MRNTQVIMKEGIECLLKNFGALETEIFITNILKEPFDYTEWQKKYFSAFPLEELNQMAARYNQENPFQKIEH